ncbi:MAG: type I restriction enzyme HsdR N-terminal domain-containing protein [Prevotellaceae bacterium]|nr:type I restriction enzyme HsdR N-terminal domain-containing protein [Prevotellaceae bacterium]
MYRLNLPQYEIKITEINGHAAIFDILRRKYVNLTPEEWVRQHFIHFLIEHKDYPAALLANEVELQCGDKRLRCDSVLYGSDMKPKMIMEYKAPDVAITQKVFTQISAYNMLLHVDYLVVSNGLQHYCCKINYEKRSCQFLEDIPLYGEI